MDLSTSEAEGIAEVMSGLSTAIRVRILARLLSSTATVSQLTEELDLAQAAVSNHLRVLRHLNLVTGERKGKNVIYRLRDDHVHTMIVEVLEHTRHS